jgi:hypothetical protein
VGRQRKIADQLYEDLAQSIYEPDMKFKNFNQPFIFRLIIVFPDHH